jgi:hypothetical protein
MKDCAVVLSLLTRPLTYPVNNNLPFKIPSVIIISDVSEPKSSCPSILYSIYVVITCNIHSVPAPPLDSIVVYRRPRHICRYACCMKTKVSRP